MAKEKLYTSSEIGDLLQVDTSSVVKWVNDGLLFAYRTPGGHRRLRSRDVVAFLHKHGMYVPPELATGRRKVLFVDDDSHLISSVKRAMKAHADQVDLLTAQGGVEAMVSIGVDRPDVVFLDYGMPHLDGLEVLEQLRARQETRSIEVVLLSGRITPDLKKRAHALGAKAVKAKPISAAEIVELSSARAAA